MFQGTRRDKKVALTNEELLSAYRYMVMGRMVEEAITKIKGNYHPAIGEEAVIVGTFYNLRKDDVIVPHYRGALIAYIMRGASYEDCLLESWERDEFIPVVVIGVISGVRLS